MKFGVCASSLNPEDIQTLAPGHGGNNFRRQAPHLHYNLKLKKFKKKNKNYWKAKKNIQNHRNWNKWRHPVSLQSCFFYAFVWGIVLTSWTLKFRKKLTVLLAWRTKAVNLGFPQPLHSEGGKTSKNRARKGSPKPGCKLNINCVQTQYSAWVSDLLHGGRILSSPAKGVTI